jgi:DNA-binding MarR family transcriptional regulator
MNTCLALCNTLPMQDMIRAQRPLPQGTRAHSDRQSPTKDELAAFEVATRDLAGLALRSIDQLGDEISLPQFRLLLVVHDLGPSSSTEVAQAMGLAGSSVTRLADRMTASGYLVRGADPNNRCVVTLSLTTSGQSLVRKVIRRRQRELSELLDGLDPALRARCAEGLRALHTLVGDAYSIGSQGPIPL